MDPHTRCGTKIKMATKKVAVEQLDPESTSAMRYCRADPNAKLAFPGSKSGRADACYPH